MTQKKKKKKRKKRKKRCDTRHPLCHNGGLDRRLMDIRTFGLNPGLGLLSAKPSAASVRF